MNSGNVGHRGTSVPIGGTSYVVQSGDKLMWRQYQSGTARGGLYVGFTDGGAVNWSAVDGEGQATNDDTTTGSWHTRVINLTPFANRTVNMLAPINDVNSANGTFDLYFADIAVVGTNGSVYSFMNGADAGSLPCTPFFDATVSNASAVVEHGTGLPSDNARPRFYVSDQVRTASMELSSAGWPVWKGEFGPFGAELDTQATANRYKFTGKERDTESGLDYFGARYYGSNMGRWMSPDWSDKPSPVPYADLANPQSLNLYSYVRNNPLSQRDDDGHSSQTEEAEAHYEFFLAAARQMANPPQAQQQNGDPAAPAAGQTPTAPPPSWKPGDPFPSDPSGLGPDWVRDPGHKAPNDEHWINPGTGDKVEWHPGQPGKPGWNGEDHWHWLPGGDKEKPHYSPGDRIKTFWADHKRAIVVTGAVIVVVGAVALAPVTGGASLGALAAVP